ncbi:MAG: M20/M25/M40 family metallo-hydrolase [Chloroflexi bacterium]|nr:M20/M25/M40 family metallo-hydrolase [Chloroflexota bacterium]
MFDAKRTIADLVQSPLLAAIRQQIAPERIIDDAIAIQQVAAPTFDEGRRAALVREQFARYTLKDISTDAVYNVYGRRPGQHPDKPALLVSAHLDTVFPLETDLAVRHAGERIYGPGLGDNSLGVAGLLALLNLFHTHEMHLPVDVWFVANSREEGLGDLGGIRAVWETLGHQLGAAIVLEGMALGHIYHAGIAVRRLRITCTAPGGHSWLHFGQASAIHSLMALGAEITSLTPPVQPRTTFNIGLISGGHSINSLATMAELYLDLRSEETSTLAALEQQVRDAIERLREPGVDFAVDVVGDRPAGSIPADDPLVALAAAALHTIDQDVAYESGSTDANVLLANGLPTVTVGISRGGNAHRLDEYIETAPIADGVWHLLLLALAAANTVSEW